MQPGCVKMMEVQDFLSSCQSWAFLRPPFLLCSGTYASFFLRSSGSESVRFWPFSLTYLKPPLSSACFFPQDGYFLSRPRCPLSPALICPGGRRSTRSAPGSV